MALAAGDFSSIKRTGLSPGRWMVTGVWTLPASYTSGGEPLTNAIVAAKLGLKTVDQIIFTPKAGSATATFDGTSTSTTQGKLHVYQSGTGAHTHSFLVKGGTAAAGTDALNIKATIIGKEAATDATNTGGTNGGVQTTTAANTSTEVVAGQNLGTNTVSFIAYGS